MAGGKYTMNDQLRIKKKDTGDLHVVEGPHRTCPGKLEVPTLKEQEALGAMKSIKEHVRALKKHLVLLRSLANNEKADEILTKENELACLKVDWNRWEEKRKTAARERMIILGHEEEPT